MQTTIATPTKSLWKKAAVFILVAGGISLTLGTMTYFSSVGLSGRVFFFTQTMRFVSWSLASPFIYLAIKRFRRGPGRRWFAIIGSHLALGLSSLLIVSLLYVVFVYMVRGPFETLESTISWYRMVFFAVLYIGVMCYGLIALGTEALLFHRRYVQEERKAAGLVGELARARLRALQMQLQPHFLFNTLHSISSLIFEDPQKANAMVARLGDFLRLTLDFSEDQMVTVEREIDFLRCYLDIQKIRFEERLTVNIDIDPAALHASVPHLILQPIVENAILHGFSTRNTPGTIEIEAKRRNGTLWMKVSDDGPGMAPAGAKKSARKGVGLSNIRGRLEQLYGPLYKMELGNVPEGGFSVVLETPLRIVSSGDPGT